MHLSNLVFRYNITCVQTKIKIGKTAKCPGFASHLIVVLVLLREDELVPVTRVLQPLFGRDHAARSWLVKETVSQ
jgi:hypothetical protein